MTNLFDCIRVHAMDDNEKAQCILDSKHLNMLSTDASLQIRLRAKKEIREKVARTHKYLQQCSQGLLHRLADDTDFEIRTAARAQIRALDK